MIKLLLLLSWGYLTLVAATNHITMFTSFARTGDDVAILEGELLDWTVRYAVQQVNADPQLLANHPVVIFPEDSAKSGLKAPVNLAALLGQTGHYSVLGDTVNDITTSLATFANAAQIPIVSPGAGSQQLSDSTRFRTFARTVPSDVATATALMNFMQYHGWLEASLVYAETSGSTSFVQTLKEAFDSAAAAQSANYFKPTVSAYTDAADSYIPLSKSKFNVAQELLLPANFASPTSASYKTDSSLVDDLLDQLLASNSILLVVVCPPSHFLALLKAMVAKGIKGGQYQIITVNIGHPSLLSLETGPTKDALVSLMKGMISINPRLVNNAISSALMERCRLEMPNKCESPSPAQFYFYDAIFAMALAYQAGLAESATLALPGGIRMVALMKNQRFTGATGEVRFAANGDRVPAFDVVNLAGGKFQTVGTWDTPGTTGSVVVTQPGLSSGVANPTAVHGGLVLSTNPSIIWADGSFQTPKAVSLKTIELGYLGPLSGPDSFVGAIVRAAVIGAVETINQRKDLLPGYQVRLKISDTRSNARLTFQNAVEMCGRGDIKGLIVGYADEEAGAATSVALGYGTPQLSYFAPKADLSDSRHPYKAFNRVIEAQKLLGTAVCRVMDQFYWPYFGIMHDSTSESAQLADNVINSSFRGAQNLFLRFPLDFTAGLDVVQRQIRAGLRALEASIYRVLVVVCGQPSMHLTIYREMQKMGLIGSYVIIITEVVRGDIFDQVGESDKAELYSLMTGALSVSPPGLSGIATVVRNQCLFNEPLCSLSTQDRRLLPIFYAYDAVQLWAESLNRLLKDKKEFTFANQVQYLRGFTYQGVTGPIKLDPVGDRYARYEILNVLNDNVFSVGVWEQESKYRGFTQYGDPVWPDLTIVVPFGRVITVSTVTEDSRKTAIGLAFGLLCFSVLASFWTFTNKEDPSVVMIGHLVMQLIIWGCNFYYILLIGLAYIDENARYRCEFLTAFSSVAFSLFIPGVLTKVWVDYQINYNLVPSKSMRPTSILLKVFLYWMYELCFYICWMIIAKPHPEVIWLGSLDLYYRCTVDSSNFVFFNTFHKAAMLIICLVMSNHIKRSKHNMRVTRGFHNGLVAVVVWFFATWFYWTDKPRSQQRMFYFYNFVIMASLALLEIGLFLPVYQLDLANRHAQARIIDYHIQTQNEQLRVAEQEKFKKSASNRAVA